GTPVPNAEVGLGLTDLAVLTIADPNSPELLPFFYSERGITVVTSSPLTINVDQATQIIIDTIKGGGGGYGEGGIFEVRQEFVDTPLWEPSVITDENGQATVSVTLPDNLTTWRMDARAVTTGEDGPMLVGQNTSDLLSTKPVLIRPTTGRFFIVGDRATLAAVVNNNTSQDMLAEVTLEGSGFVLGDDVPNSQWVEIPAKGRARVNWPVEVQDVPFVDATFYVNANNGQYTDASKPPLGQGEDRTLPVYKYEAPETVGTAGTLYGPDASSRTEAIVLPRRYNVTQGELTVRLDRSLAAATVDGMTWLRNYPYYCIEQIVSRFLPNAVTLRSLRDLGLDDPVLEANLQIQVSYALQRLYSQQKPDGGWGWFPTDESNPIVTAYALIGLTEAQRAGFDINTGVVSRAANFVGESLRTIRPQDNLWQVNRQAFLLYALAWSGRGNVSATVRLFDERETMSLFAKAYLAMTFHLIDPDDTRAMELVNDLNNALIVSATGGHWEETYQDWWNWNTNTRTTALGLMAMAQIDPDNQLIPNVVRWLMVARTADHWETTQETAWSVMALTEWMVVTGELYPDYEFAVSLNGARQSLDDNTATPDNVKETEVLRIQVADLIEDVNRLTFSRTDGDGNLYYTAHLTAYLPVPEIEALDRGIILSRKYSLLDDPESKPVTSAEVGQPVQVTLTIIAPNNLHYVVIEDPFPAGADAVNPNLNTSSIVGTRPTLNRDRPLSRGWGWWWFSNIEMRDEKVVLYATYLPRGTYQFNYVIYPGLAGEYNVIPTTGQEFYFPEVYGRADGSQFTITGGTPSDAIEPPADTAADTAEANAGFEEAPADSSAGADSQADETADSAEGEEFPLLWDVLEADGRFGTLLDLFVEAGLDSVLLSPDLLTVFAPTDDALAALPEHLASNPDTLALVLLYHLLDEAYYEEDLGNYQFVTLMGETILVIPVDDVISLDHMAEITETDLEAANGVIHVIDGVLIPPTLAKLSAEDVAADHTAPQIEIGAVDAESKDDEAKDDESDAAETESGDDMTAEDTDSGPVEQGTDIPLPPLTESYTTADGLTFSYPVDWVVEDVGSGPVTLASDAATAESQIVTPGTVGINFLQPEFVSSILFLSEGPPADVLNEYRGDSVNENEAITWGEIEDIMLGDRIAAFLTVSNISEEFNVEGIIIALDVSDTVGAGAVLLVIGAAYPGELEMWQPLLLDIAASLSYTPTETPDEAESDSTDETGETGETGAAEESAEPQQFEAVESAGADESVEIGEPGESEGVEESAEPAAAEPSDLISMMLADGRFEMVGNLVATQPDLRALLEGDEPVTIFLPVDDAFLDVSSDLITTLMSDPGLLIAALQYHMVAGALMIEDLSDLDTITTIEGTDIALSVDADGNLVLNDIVMVIEADIEATNGVIHVIDGVLLVPDEE
ncbi:MAG: fasciclin domain-containing protein, partial [Anaerolineae bacterium]|nr:fasciclin domain-containing protein [Anaerolineae bacterium]